MHSAARLVLVLLALVAMRAAALAPGKPLPRVHIAAAGELQFVGDQLNLVPWDSSSLAGKLQVVQYLAARRSARDINRPFTDRLERSGISLDRYHLTTIVNLDDAMFGTRSLVMAELESNKRRYFRSTIVADTEGAGRAAWGLAARSSAILVVDAAGCVLFFRDGALAAEEIERVIELVRGGA